MTIDPRRTALVLIGFQRDYFNEDGILHGVVEESHRVSGTLENTLEFIEAFKDSEMLMVNTPIVFSELYEELENPIGILKTIRDVEAFKQGAPGSEVIDELGAFGTGSSPCPGRRASTHSPTPSWARRSGSTTSTRWSSPAASPPSASTQPRSTPDPAQRGPALGLHLVEDRHRAGLLLRKRVPALRRGRALHRPHPVSG